MNKCDVIIPVYKSPEWVKLCVYAVFKNTDDNDLNKVYLINDCASDELTTNCLNNLKEKYSKIEILTNEQNLGFVKSTNRGMKESTADYVLLLNTDCIVSKNAITKLMNHLKENKDIGLICPISSNAANLTLEMFPGFSFSNMNNLLERKFKGKLFDACTVVGNCLMISRACIDKVGYLDEAYGMGYGEETDYQFKSMAAGFSAKVAIDTYVFHKSEVSFGVSKEKQERLNKNRELFFSRWGKEYYKLMEEYTKNDPIKYINDNITDKDKKLSFEFLIYLMGFSQNAGGVHMTVDLVNYLVINNYNCNIIYGFFNEYNEIMLYNPIQVNDIDKFKFKKLVSTIYLSVYYLKELADKYNVPLIYFAQGYEPYFENGRDYGVAELSYKLSDSILTISNYLKNRYKDMFNEKAHVVTNGINYDLLHHENDSDSIKTITLVLRNNPLKGDYMLLDIYKKIVSKYKNIKINLLYNDEKIVFPFNEFDNVNKMKGPFTRKELATILQKSDLFIDASLTEGFGLMGLEAMCAGNVVIVSDSGGINEYLENGHGGYIIKEVNNVEKYIEKIFYLLDNKNEYLKQKSFLKNIVRKYDYDNIIDEYITYFDKEITKKEIIMNDAEKEVYSNLLDSKFKISKRSPLKNFFYNMCKKIPKKWRIWMKHKVEKLYNFVNVR